jgi:D-arginine dehydrogenase
MGVRFCPTLRRLDAAEALKIVPVLNPDYVDGAVHEPDCMDIDVNALHQGYLRGAKAHGTVLVTDAEVIAAERANGAWRARTSAGDFSAPVLVDAAGAWADELAKLAGVPTVGLVPKRRTAFVFDGPAGIDAAHWPLTDCVDEQWYFKPESGRFLGSPADETPMPPCDVQPEELDIAIAADRIQQATTLSITHIRRKWAGLRSFVADKTLVIGPTAKAEGFFWLAGQGGYGIQTSFAAADCLAALIDGGDIPALLKELGLTGAALSPDRPLGQA